MEYMTSAGNTPAKKVSIAFLIMLFGSILLLGAFFMPFAAAKKEHKEDLLKYSDEMYFDDISMTNKEAVNMSMPELLQIYSNAAAAGQSKAIGTVCVVLIILTALMTILTLLFTIIKKPVAAIVFACLTAIVTAIFGWDMKARRAIENSSYKYGISHYLYYICVVIIIAGAVWLIIENSKRKEEKTA